VESNNQAHVEDLAKAGLPGFKAFLINPGIDGFTMVTERELAGGAAARGEKRIAAGWARRKFEAVPIDKAARELANADWRKYETYLRSRPDEAESCCDRV